MDNIWSHKHLANPRCKTCWCAKHKCMLHPQVLMLLYSVFLLVLLWLCLFVYAHICTVLTVCACRYVCMWLYCHRPKQQLHSLALSYFLNRDNANANIFANVCQWRTLSGFLNMQCQSGNNTIYFSCSRSHLTSLKVQKNHVFFFMWTRTHDRAAEKKKQHRKL